jgi:hypothetical protein
MSGRETTSKTITNLRHSRRMQKGKEHREYSEEEKAFVRSLSGTRSNREIAEAFRLRFGREPSVCAIANLRPVCAIANLRQRHGMPLTQERPKPRRQRQGNIVRRAGRVDP